MAQSQTFGRRGSAPQAPVLQATVRPPPADAPLSPELEAFRASLKAAPPQGEDHAFADWLRAQRARRWLLIGVRLAFLAPGLLCFLFQAPWWASFGLEGLGLLANGWIKTERKKQASEIAGWSAAPDRK
jgi:hypothetical protein